MTSVSTCDVVRGNARGGYPQEYLAARVRGRQAYLITDWDAPAVRGLTSGLSDEQVWELLLAELRWLHRQMDPATLRQTAPLFGLFAVKTLVLALRNISVGRHEVVRALLEKSLLAEPIARILRRADDVSVALNELAHPDVPAARLFAELPVLYAQGKLRAIEDGLMRRYLECTAHSPLHPLLRQFIVRFIDLRNIVLVYKHLRWDVAEPCRVTAGGEISIEVLDAIVERHEMHALDTLVRRTAGRHLPVAVSDAALEAMLLRVITADLRQYRRGERTVHVVVSYMWRCYVQARNLALHVHATDVAPDALQRELIA